MATPQTASPASDTGCPTGTRRRILDALAAYIDEHGYSPTVRELGQAVGLTSTSTVAWHLLVLLEGGWITNPGQPRTIRLARPLPEGA